MSTPSETGPSALPLSVLGRVDEAGDRFEDAWEAGQRPAIEAFLAEVPEPERPVLLHELLRMELGYRRRGGEAPTPAEYRDRFPDHIALIQHVFGETGSPTNGADPPAADLSATRHEPAPARGAPPAPTILGYEILGELGHGGMGVVYWARHTRLNRLVALKLIRTGAQASAEELARFRTEAEAVARLQHPHVVQIYEVGEQDGLSYLALEYVENGSLAARLDGTPLPPQQAARLVEILARAMHAAHAQGIVHRDLKPANVLLTADGTPKVTDFGLAKKLDAAAGPTVSGAILGTPSYMAPEQTGGRHRSVGPATDVYALGAILYELLTGRPPFKAATTLETVFQVVHEEPVRPRQLQSKTPADLEAICLKCLEKEPRRRYESAAALADDLRRFQEGKPTWARPVGTGVGRGAGAGATRRWPGWSCSRVGQFWNRAGDSGKLISSWS